MDKLCSYLKIVFFIISTSLLTGCTTQGYSVIASTATTIGLGVSQQPTSGMIDATLGYKRAEVAFVPTNRNAGENAGEVNGKNGSGAKDSANVIMELRYSDLFSSGEKSGIYQRLAVGETAVSQDGATLMFARDSNGNIDAATRSTLAALESTQKYKPSYLKKKISNKYDALKSNQYELDKFNRSVPSGKYQSFDEYYNDENTSEEEDYNVLRNLEKNGVQF